MKNKNYYTSISGEDGFREVSGKKGKQKQGKIFGVVMMNPILMIKRKNFTSCGRERKNATNETTNNVYVGEQQQRSGKRTNIRAINKNKNDNKRLIGMIKPIQGEKYYRNKKPQKHPG
ncbi:hypothetical protein H5410_007551 [Solanum commersonii]|uniref:Uncharacterized protein n=1 Tax=Solanum commersonii TaxID=4109 RepID=A0A9J6ACE7_SOLCO|nr:hypothetical protein H5410_007551 [Solanum commersonii]